MLINLIIHKLKHQLELLWHINLKTTHLTSKILYIYHLQNHELQKETQLTVKISQNQIQLSLIIHFIIRQTVLKN